MTEGHPHTSHASLIGVLADRLLSGPSATAILEDWCRERRIVAEPRLLAHPVATAHKPPTIEQRERLALAEDEIVRYRRVRLACDGLVLSEAENWYVPGRLDPAMNRLLDSSTTPFGRIVHPLEPQRRNLALDILWTDQDARIRPDTQLFSIRALPSTGRGLPFCEVIETYRGAVLDGAG